MIKRAGREQQYRPCLAIEQTAKSSPVWVEGYMCVPSGVPERFSPCADYQLTLPESIGT